MAYTVQLFDHVTLPIVLLSARGTYDKVVVLLHIILKF